MEIVIGLAIVAALVGVSIVYGKMSTKAKTEQKKVKLARQQLKEQQQRPSNKDELIKRVKDKGL